VLLEAWDANPLGGDQSYRGVRGERWKYVEYISGVEGPELYDLVTDPAELTSVASDPAHASTMAALRARVQELTAP
jgi:hypothetical protein